MEKRSKRSLSSAQNPSVKKAKALPVWEVPDLADAELDAFQTWLRGGLMQSECALHSYYRNQSKRSSLRGHQNREQSRLSPAFPFLPLPLQNELIFFIHSPSSCYSSARIRFKTAFWGNLDVHHVARSANGPLLLLTVAKRSLISTSLNLILGLPLWFEGTTLPVLDAIVMLEKKKIYLIEAPLAARIISLINI